MKVAFVGKGGSGKTTISALVSKHLASLGFPVMAIDADINQHLGQALGLSKKEAQDMKPMGIEISKMKEYLRGSNPLILHSQSMIKTTPPGRGSALMKIAEENPIYDYFSKMVSGIRFLAVGQFDESDLGVKCYHSKTGSVELLLNHLLDKEKEYVLVDMTAGADSFASGLFTRFDITFLVVEPTIKSLSVYDQYKKFAKDFGVTIKVVGNKIEDQSDIDFIKDWVGDDLIAVFYRSSFIKKIDRGVGASFDELEPENKESLKKIVSEINSQKKDWEKFYRQAIFFHVQNANSWANTSLGFDVTCQIDPNFSLTDIIGN